MCPLQGCGEQSQTVEWFVLDSTDGPIEHVTVVCTGGHGFTLSTERLDRFRTDQGRR